LLVIILMNKPSAGKGHVIKTPVGVLSQPVKPKPVKWKMERKRPAKDYSPRKLLEMGVLVNGSGSFKAENGIPIYFLVTISSPNKTRQFRVGDIKLHLESVSNSQKVPAAFRAVGKNLIWELKSDLKPGKYFVRASFAKPNDRDSKLKISPAILTVSNTTPSLALKAYYQRKALIYEGKFAEFATKVKQAHKKDPENIRLQIELAKALELNGDKNAARKQLLKSAIQIQDSAGFSEKGQANPVPDWLVWDIERLK